MGSEHILFILFVFVDPILFLLFVDVHCCILTLKAGQTASPSREFFHSLIQGIL